MPRKKRLMKIRRRDVPTALVRYLLGDAISREDRQQYAWEIFQLDHPVSAEALQLWELAREIVLAEWINRYPGTRPRLWWEFDSPKQPLGIWRSAYFDGTLPEPRERLGGTGEAPWDTGLSYVPHYRCGVPNSWVDLDEDDPPVFESQAVYLRRHDRLDAIEKRRLKPKDFEPVAIEVEGERNGRERATIEE